EAPAATVLLTAHRDLEKLVLTKRELEIKQYLEKMWSNLVYSGLWTDPSREDIEAFIERTQERVTGTVRVKLFKGSMRVVGRRSPFALYERELITYRSESIFDQKAAEGFIKLWGLSTTTAAKKLRRKV
ncbi:MAG TPA: argininosuccinate synthase, partial [Candidatus Bathyarchaeota archaeon]|nr:argininosuccinate synthase [Candidatus Bathyarchaeota archaeon]